MAGGCKAALLKLACIRWLWFGTVAYVSLFLILKWNIKTDFNIGDLHQICQSPEMKQAVCSCRRNTPFGMRETKLSPSRHHVSMATTVPWTKPSWRQIGQEVQKRTSEVKNHHPEHKTPAYSNPREKRHVAFVKTHKAASSTVLNILYRFARDRDLVVLLPKSGNYIHGRYLNKTSLLPPPSGKTYDILCNHAIFNHTSFSTFLPSDTAYISIVREPYQRFLSAYYYFKYVSTRTYLTRISGNYHQGLKHYLSNPARWEPKNPALSMTNNRMVIDFGFPPEHFHRQSYFDDYLLKLNRTFRVVMVTERFDESLVLLKRALNWTIKDILYNIKNKARIKPSQVANVDNLKQNYKNWSNLDRKLYSFFQKRLDMDIKQQGRRFNEEVAYFKLVKNNVANYCTYGHHKRQLDIPRGNWTEAFTINRKACRYMRMEELDFLYYIRTQQTIETTRWGINAEFMKSLP